jgi:hypothetical protein
VLVSRATIHHLRASWWSSPARKLRGIPAGFVAELTGEEVARVARHHPPPPGFMAELTY